MKSSLEARSGDPCTEWVTGLQHKSLPSTQSPVEWDSARHFQCRLHEVRVSAMNQSVHELPSHLEAPRLGV